MEFGISQPVLAAVAAFFAAVVLTPLVIRVAHARGLLAAPRADRWHTRPTALFGGVAIFAAVSLVGVLVLPWTATNVGILLGTAVIFGVGLVDDVLRIKPSSKLIGQIAAACVAVLAGVQMEAISNPFLAIPLTVFWIVAITNAFNLIDNMDGLSAGVAAISAVFIVVFAHMQGNADVAELAALLGGAAAGFLLFNFNPARVFMGDCGSMVLGYVLACAALVGTWHQASNLFLILAAPALLLAVPIFDATLVTVLRTFAGRPVSQGGRDHSSHRLVALGLSERRAVVTLYVVCVSFGLVALAGLAYNLFAAAVGSLLLLVGICLFGIFLGQVPVYGRARLGANGAGRAPPALINTLLLHKRRFAEVTLDFVLICVAYASAYLLRFEGEIPAQYGPVILKTLPILIVLKMSAFFLFGVYRGVWRYVGIRDAVKLANAVLAGSVAVVIALVLAYRFEDLSRSVFVLDGLLLLFFMAGARVMLRVFREMLVPTEGNGRRVLVIGAGDGGEMLLRELRNNPGLNLSPVGLIDDDPEKRGRQVHGVTVLGTQEDLEEIAARVDAQELVIAIPSASGEALSAIAARCAETGLPYRTTRRLTELVDGQVTGELRELEILDVVQRRAPRIDDATVRAAVEGKAIAILGAGGTLGAAVARRSLAFGPARLFLADRDDNALSNLRDSLSAGEIKVELALVDVTAREQLEALLGRFRPDVIVHAAAVSQFGILEGSAASAVRVNVAGADSAAKAARSAGAGTFVLASSVKAGRTDTVLGATRSLAERVVRRHGNKTMSVRVVRLGNVLGSRGGLLARFREQALSGRPITLTDRQAARYVLAVEEAASALLTAAGEPPEGLNIPEASVLFPDHGDQVRVEEIARAVSSWVRARPEMSNTAPVEVQVVGLRPGEALRDPEPDGPLVGAGRGLYAFVPALRADDVDLDRWFAELEAASRRGEDARVREVLARFYPDLGPSFDASENVIPLKRS